MRMDAPMISAAQPMPLGELAAGLGRVRGDATIQVQSIAIDSRQVTPGALFVARRGLAVDGHRYAADAVARGAVAVAVEASAAARKTVEGFMSLLLSACRARRRRRGGLRDPWP